MKLSLFFNLDMKKIMKASTGLDKSVRGHFAKTTGT